jgi:hypothetical protein
MGLLLVENASSPNVRATGKDGRTKHVVGYHGMIYRYRVVPGDYTSKGMIEARP